MIVFLQVNGVPLLVVLFMLVVIGVGLRGSEGSCGMAMHQQMRQPPPKKRLESRLNESALDPSGIRVASPTAGAQHSQESQLTRRENQ